MANFNTGKDTAGSSPMDVTGQMTVGGTRPTNQPASGSLGGAKGDRPNSPKK